MNTLITTLKFLLLVAGMSLFLFTSCFAQQLFSLTITTNKEPVKLLVEIAKTETTRENGLMKRKYLPANQGMLFEFNKIQYLNFWMKNTLIPLDILFINDHWQIVDIKTMQPCVQSPCAIYSSALPAKYALELNAGFTQQHSVVVGNSLNWK